MAWRGGGRLGAFALVDVGEAVPRHEKEVIKVLGAALLRQGEDHGKERVVVVCASRGGGGDCSANGDAQPRCSANAVPMKREEEEVAADGERGNGGGAAVGLGGEKD